MMSPWGWTGIKGSKNVGMCYTINVIKLYICWTINIEDLNIFARIRS
jgi:hypothetical protein